MMAASPEEPPRSAVLLLHSRIELSSDFVLRNYVPLANLIGIIFQIRDDYVNLQSAQVSSKAAVLTPTALITSDSQYADNKGYCEDFTEGKFSFPIVHSIRADSSNRQILSALPSASVRPTPR